MLDLLLGLDLMSISSWPSRQFGRSDHRFRWGSLFVSEDIQPLSQRHFPVRRYSRGGGGRLSRDSRGYVLLRFGGENEGASPGGRAKCLGTWRQ